LLCDTGALAISPSVYTKLPFDPAKDLRGVTMLAYSPRMLAVHPSVKANNLKELVALSKTTDLNFAVTAMGSAPHLAGVAVERASGAKWIYVPYKGGAPALQDTLGGQVDFFMTNINAVLPQIRAGKLHAIAITSDKRSPALPNVPTFGEAGVQGM